MYKRYCHYLPCAYKGCRQPVSPGSDYCYLHFDMLGKEKR